MAVIVETGDLLKTIAVSLIAGVGMTVIFSIAIWGAARFVDLSRDERPLVAGVAAALAAGAFVVTVAAVAIGIVAMAQK